MTTILVIDDDVFTASLVRAAVPDWTVEAVLDGLLALDRLRQGSATQPLPDLILLDISMPGINGYETCVAIRFMNVTVPIVPYTATQEVRADYLRDLGCTSVVYKGIGADELGEHLHTTLTTYVPVQIPVATLLELYRGVLVVEEQARRARVYMRVGLLASSIIERMGLKMLLDGAGRAGLGGQRHRYGAATAADASPLYGAGCGGARPACRPGSRRGLGCPGVVPGRYAGRRSGIAVAA